MLFNICTACSQVNPADAEVCQTCGQRFGVHPSGAPVVRITAEWRSPGALWFDELGPLDTVPAAMPAEDKPVPPQVAITLRDVEIPVLDDVVPPAAGAPGRHGQAGDLFLNDAEPAPPSAAHGHEGFEGDLDAWLSADRAAARAAVRRSRLRRSALGHDDGEPVPEVLVLDHDSVARDGLCTLLRGFGFGVHSVADIGKASALVATRPFVASFIDVALDTSDGGAGIALCRRIRSAGARRGGAPPVLVLVSAHLQPVDRVRAELAGCDDVLIKPLTRGDVARVLDSRGVALPADARRI